MIGKIIIEINEIVIEIRKIITNKKYIEMNLSKKTTTILVIVAVVLVFGGFLIFKYNGLVKMNESCNSQWSVVQSQYQRRMDLIPNLVSTVKGYAAHEQETLTKVIEARNSASKAIESKDAKQIEQTQSALNTAMRNFNILVERYPDLKANQNFLELQSQLEGTENRIAVERKKYAEAVQKYNQKRNTFPTNIVAGMFGFNAKEYYNADAGSENAPKVSF